MSVESADANEGVAVSSRARAGLWMTASALEEFDSVLLGGAGQSVDKRPKRSEVLCLFVQLDRQRN